jgi:large subunit ribosomal protein L17
MKHRVGYNRLGRKASHRKALHRNMTTSLFRYERIRTTKAKALAIRRTAEKMITRAKEDSVHNRRMIARDINDKEIVAKLFTEIGPRFKSRPGGYTRILKLGHRKGDAAEMVLMELVEEEAGEASKKKGKKKSTKKSDSAAPSPAKKEKREDKPEADGTPEVTEEPAADMKAAVETEEKKDTQEDKDEAETDKTAEDEKEAEADDK